jgi:hypothetical protein
LAVFQTRPAAAQRLVAVLVAVSLPELLSVAVFDAVPTAVAELV